ncbi:hypothetical protein, partial [Daejeonella sp.]|uniref:hypothetical protein n=1 Tax=Daejeonella sp. TaxID=2805397 RepID=UPI003983B154
LYSNQGFGQSDLKHSDYHGLNHFNKRSGLPSFASPDPRGRDLMIKFGLAAGAVLTEEYKHMMGMKFGLEKSLNKSISATVSAGFNLYKLDRNLIDETVIIAPFKLGAKFWVAEKFFVHTEGGFALGVNDYVDRIIYGVTIGKVFKNGISLGLGFESLQSPSSEWLYYDDPTFLGLKIDFPIYQGKIFRNTNMVAEPPENTGRKKAYAFIEFGGAGGALSAQIDQRFSVDRNDGLGYRVGLGNYNDVISVPIGMNYIFGKKRSGLELGLGLTTYFDLKKDDNFFNNENSVGLSPLFTVGYRLQSYNGFMLRLNSSAIYDFDVNYIFPFFPGLSVGYRIR